jgi:hypothetical protein
MSTPRSHTHVLNVSRELQPIAGDLAAIFARCHRDETAEPDFESIGVGVVN